MTYFQFLAIFLVLPIVVLLVTSRNTVPVRLAVAIAVLMVVALLYTAPWDNALVLNGVWSFSTRQVNGTLIGVVPIEEYLFYLLQVLLTGLLTVWLMRYGRARDG